MMIDQEARIAELEQQLLDLQQQAVTVRIDTLSEVKHNVLGTTLIVAPESVSQRVGAESIVKQIVCVIDALIDQEVRDAPVQT
jgi:hypothetical protein